MNERKLRQLNILTLITAVVSFIFIVIFVFVLAPDGNNRIGMSGLTKYNDRWVLKNYRGQADEIVTLPLSLDADAEEIITIMAQVPEDVNKDSVLLFRTEFQNIVVMIGEKRVYSNGVMTDQKLMKNAVPCYNVVSLAETKPGDVITIHMASGYKRYSGRIGEIYYGTQGDVMTELIRNDGAGFVFGITLLVITILLAISLITMQDVNVDKRKAGYAFGFIFAATVWSLTQNSIMQVVTGNNFGVYMTGMVLLLLMPVLYLMYQRCFAVKRRFARIFEIGIYVFAINMLVGVVFQMLSVSDFATYMIFTKILITVGMLLLSGIMYLAADTFSDKTIYSNLWANLVLTAACILEAFLSLFRFYKAYDGLVLQIGIYVFVVLLVVTVEKSIIREMNQQRDMAMNSIGLEKEKTVKNINTGFIYGALNLAINDLKDRDRENSRLIYDTSIYMKHNLEALTNTGMVPFSKELEYIRAYLGIQCKRNVGLEVEIEDKVTEFLVPFNTVEPLVENAVMNGALNAEISGRIVIRSYERLDCFAIQIVDNGRGIGPDKKFSGKQSYKAIRKRLKNMCGAGVEIKTKPDKGTILTVKVPKDGYIIKE